MRLYYSFQDANSLHMILDYCPGGDLYDRIEAEGCVSVERARLYGTLRDGLPELAKEISDAERKLAALKRKRDEVTAAIRQAEGMS